MNKFQKNGVRLLLVGGVFTFLGLWSAAISKEASRDRVAGWLGNDVLRGRTVFLVSGNRPAVSAFRSRSIKVGLLPNQTTPRPEGSFLAWISTKGH